MRTHYIPFGKVADIAATVLAFELDLTAYTAKAYINGRTITVNTNTGGVSGMGQVASMAAVAAALTPLEALAAVVQEWAHLAREARDIEDHGAPNAYAHIPAEWRSVIWDHSGDYGLADDLELVAYDLRTLGSWE